MPIHFSGSKLISDAALLSAVATCDADFARGCCEDFIFRKQLKNTLENKADTLAHEMEIRQGKTCCL